MTFSFLETEACFLANEGDGSTRIPEITINFFPNSPEIVPISGAIFQTTGTLALTQCTFSSNQAEQFGGAIYNATPMPTLTLANSIFVGNNAGAAGRDIYDQSTVTLTGVNFIGDADGSGLTASAALLTTAVNGSINLAPLGAYGGLALLPGSPARNAAAVLSPAFTSDQRGFPIVGPPDIGAYEAGDVTNFNAWIYENLPASTALNAAQHAAGFDFDGDGVSNGNEWLALTNPGDPANYVRITQIVRTANNLNVTFPSVPARHYSLEYTTDFVTWTPIPGPATTGTGNPITLNVGPVNTFPKFFLRTRVGP